MAVVRNLMIRIGADYSPAKKSMDGATRELTKFRRDTERTSATIRGKNGLGGIATEYKNLGRELSASISRLRGAKGIGGVSAELTTLVPLLGRSAAGMRGLGVAATGAGARVAALAGPIGIAAVALGALVAVSAAASQEAIRYESTIGRLNMQLKEGSREFMTWARSMGLAKQTAADLGATYGTLLSSFISDSKQLQQSTKDIAQATRILVSGTGRPIEEVLERVRSGLLGNTEAIEDLGVFVNVAMIESTNAFKKFANGKSWDQLDFRVQQQIRLAAILEQTYARYGTSLQNNVMGKQSLLLEQLKDIKLNLSQAFLPIWDSVLPALTRLAEGVAGITEQIARFMYMLRGWDYDEMTRGTDQQTGAVNNQAGAYEELSKSAAKARGELAGFDELNLLGDPGADSGSGGAGGSLGGPSTPSGSNSPGEGLELPKLPTVPGIKIPPPQPPDAGMGAVATAVTETVNSLATETNKSFKEMWDSAGQRTAEGATWQREQVGGFAGELTGVTIPGLTGSLREQWGQMWDDLGIRTGVGSVALATAMGQMYSQMSNSSSTATETLKTDWHGALDHMLSQLSAFRPHIEWGFHLIKVAIRGVSPALSDTVAAWSMGLNEMYSIAEKSFGSITAEIKTATEALKEYRRVSALEQKPSSNLAQEPNVEKVPNLSMGPNYETIPNLSFGPSYEWVPSLQFGPQYEMIPSYTSGPNYETVPNSIPSKESFVSSLYSNLVGAFSAENFAAIQSLIQAEAAKPQNRTAAQLYASLIGGGQLARIGAGATSKVKSIWESLKGSIGNAIPAFAGGGVVFGPTLAMVGDNPGARSDPEIIAPQSMIEESMSNGNAAIEVLLERIAAAVERGQNVQVTIAESDVGRAATNYQNGLMRRGQQPWPRL